MYSGTVERNGFRSENDAGNPRVVISWVYNNSCGTYSNIISTHNSTAS